MTDETSGAVSLVIIGNGRALFIGIAFTNAVWWVRQRIEKFVDMGENVIEAGTGTPGH